MKRTYECALRLIETRRRKGRPKYSAIPLTDQGSASIRGNSAVKGVPSLVGMKEWLQALGHSDNDIENMNVIHVAGTKGKGSTCAFTSSFLLAHSLRTGFPKRIGMYTSPDLQCIRERIQLDNQPITENLFTRYFFEVWETIMSRDLEQSTEPIRQPRYLQLLALLAFHTFIREGVDAAIFETHHGGEYDATNVIRKPVVTGITSLGMDHIAQLGPMIEDIAWHKAGIFKPEVPAFSVQQEPGASEVLRDRATEKKTDLSFVMSCDDLPTNSRVLSVPVQRINCSLAFQLATTFLRLKSSYDINAEDIQKGIDNFSWNGRFEIIEKEDAQWFLDGAHNILSLKQVAEWFSRNVDTANTENGRSGYRVLIFSHFSEERDGVALVRYLARAFSDCNLRFDHVIFTTYQEREDGTTRIDKTLKSPETPFPDLCTQYSILWKDLHPYATISIEPTIEGAIKAAKQLSVDQGGMQTLVTGSLHMVGGALKLLRP